MEIQMDPTGIINNNAQHQINVITRLLEDEKNQVCADCQD